MKTVRSLNKHRRLDWFIFLATLCFLLISCDRKQGSAHEYSIKPGHSAVYFEYAGAEQNKPFFPLVILVTGVSNEQSLRDLALVSRLTPSVVNISVRDLDALIDGIEGTLSAAPEATNADYGDFAIGIIRPANKSIRVISRKSVVDVIEHIPHAVLTNNARLSGHIKDLRSRLNY
jgi:hypothetical protein